MRIRFQGLEVGHTGHRAGDMLVTDWEWAYGDIRDSDYDREGRDGSLPGRDFLGARVGTFDLATNRQTMVESRRTAAQFLTAWRDRSLRDSAGSLVALEFQARDDPRWRRIYGRPRQSNDPNFDALQAQGVGRITCEFKQFEPLVFSGGAPNEVTLRKFEESSVGGWTPVDGGFWFPLMSEGAVGSRQGFLDVGGTEPTPPVITFRGPGTGFALDGNRGWHVGLKQGVSLAWDECLEVDPLLGTVQSYSVDNPSNRTDRYGALSRRSGSTLSRIRLRPGPENVFFTAIDDTNQSSATIAWREAFSTLA